MISVDKKIVWGGELRRVGEEINIKIHCLRAWHSQRVNENM